MQNTSEKLKNILMKLPDSSGIYLFFNANKELIYIGKATSLKNRVKSYFRGQRNPRPIEEMIHEVVDIKWQETDSVLEAIIAEANAIKKFLPKYNVLGKDNKSWNYIVITKDAYPRVETMRQHDLEGMQIKDEGEKQFACMFGPYPGLNTKAAMKLLRRLFRYSTCQPGQERPCLYYQMGQCLGVCIGEIGPQEYKRQVIKPLVMFLGGKKKQVIRLFEKEMVRASKEERFEDAARLRDQLEQLQRIQDIALLNKSFFEKDQGVRSKEHLRIEGYDISNLGATEKVASMVVFNEDGPVKNQYRKFIIKTVAGQSDVDSLAEVVERRLKHAEWPLPTVFLIDGGRPQVGRVRQVLHAGRAAVPVVGIAKGPERKRNDFILGDTNKDLIVWVEQHKELLIKVRDEAHRFAITFHRQRRAGRLLDKKTPIV